MDTRRHAPLGRRRIQLAPSPGRGRSHAHLGRTRRQLGDIYTSDHADTRRGGRFRWLLSTCLAAAVGVIAILVVIAGSTDTRQADGGLLPSLRDAPLASFRLPTASVDGLRWAIPKTDRLLIPSGAMATTFTIPDAVRQRRGNREYTMNRYYARLVARLGPVSKAEAQRVPPLNPFKLYANPTPIDAAERQEDDTQATVKIVELLGGVLPGEDGQELTAQEIAELVVRALAAEDEPGKARQGVASDGQETLSPGDLLAERSAKTAAELPSPNTSILGKSVFETEDTIDDIEGREVRVVKVQRGETLPRVLLRLGAETWQARAMTDAARSALPEGALAIGQEVHVTLVPSVVRANKMEPIRFSVFGEAQDHKVTVTRNAAGEFVASASPLDERIVRTELTDDNQPLASSLYGSLYNTAARQGVPPDVILQILKIHAYETDFRQRVRPGDAFEFFFDLKEEHKSAEGNLGELLSTAITSSGETHKFYRYRTPDGTVDYYDEQGNTSRKFLMRRPVRGEDVRITSGFGVRRHPVLQVSKMHTGVDWASPIGTPIMAAGAGVIEEAGRKGEYGNYVRIRHANGYKTAYGHMSRFAAGVTPGIKVRQGQIIGFVGTSGLSSGPHVHFEVLVKNSHDSSYGHVDPMSIQVSRERQLEGKELAEFQKERARIDDLLRRHPVSTKVATAAGRAQ
jgi:murein DD-endopeptidase MepM/ murein hydrolase activator NlpD